MVVLLTAFDTFSAEIIHHELHVRLHPADSSIIVTDTIQLPPGTDSAVFSLRNSLTVKAGEAELVLLGDSGTRTRQYQINRLPADGKVQLRYQGKIISGSTEGPFDMPGSVLNTEFVYLDMSSAWTPAFRAYPLFTFTLHVEAANTWQPVSQGERRVKTNDSTMEYVFNMPQPQHNIYLLGGQYRRYASRHEGIELEVYLFEDDASLAQKYLETAAGYISLYSNWIGRYPYAKFAIVENKWQTGYGMPSFTLLGSRVIRLPFILNTSLPHEILHNWWGNGVYVDYSDGNWSEGLTAYMSDHFIDEQQGKDSEYRRKALERYANFATKQADFPLATFRSRHNEASEAVGYSKSLMLFHMLRTMAGDEAFNQGIREFWQHYQFNYASFSELIELLYPATYSNDISRRRFTEQWLNRTGAAEISLDNVSISKLDDGHLLSVKISQQQDGPAYALQIPFEVSLPDHSQGFRDAVLLTEKSQLFTFKLKQPPLAFILDPDYDVFRLLDAKERPASLGRLFGAKTQRLVMPASATAEQIGAWQQLAGAWSSQYNNVELLYDNQIDSEKIDKDDNTAIWLLGWNNSLLADYGKNFTAQYQDAASQSLSSQALSQKLSGNIVTINNQQLRANKHAVVLLDADNTRRPLAFIGADDPEAIALLTRKLPHYRSYGQLAFELPGVNNIIKQHLPVLRSPMVWKLAE